ncbi:MAG: hypothetical protein OQJ87_07050 [Rhodospirillales bacterium]|nr:hypothetical protein [Rhodospirillales bacterium]
MPRRIALCLIAVLGSFGLTSPSTADYYDGLRAFDAGDYATAIIEWEKAGAARDTNALYRLGKLYEEGLGVPQNFVRAHAFFNLAAAAGNKDAKTARDVISARMTMDELAQARTLATEWSESGAQQLTIMQAKTGDVSRFDGEWRLTHISGSGHCSALQFTGIRITKGKIEGIASLGPDPNLGYFSGKVLPNGAFSAFTGTALVSLEISGDALLSELDWKVAMSGHATCTSTWKGRRDQ